VLLKDYFIINRARLLRDFAVAYPSMLAICVAWALRRYVATRFLPTPFEILVSIVGSCLAAAAFLLIVHGLAAYLVVVPLARRDGVSVRAYLKSGRYEVEKHSKLKRPINERIGR
jgi:hypothetical protein